jgi:hypothetical protein
MRSIRAPRPGDRPAKKTTCRSRRTACCHSAHRGCTECFTVQRNLQLGHEQIIFYSSKDPACSDLSGSPRRPLEKPHNRCSNCGGASSPGRSSRPKQRAIRRAMAQGRNAGPRYPEAAEPKSQAKAAHRRTEEHSSFTVGAGLFHIGERP